MPYGCFLNSLGYIIHSLIRSSRFDSSMGEGHMGGTLTVRLFSWGPGAHRKKAPVGEKKNKEIKGLHSG
jgi:hypothetical protein